MLFSHAIVMAACIPVEAATGYRFQPYQKLHNRNSKLVTKDNAIPETYLRSS